MNATKAEKTWNTSRPPGVMVSIVSCRVSKPTLRLRSPATIEVSSYRERLRRFRGGTHEGIAGAQGIQRLHSSSHLTFFTGFLPKKIRRHPLPVSAAIWQSTFCLVVETRA